MSTKFAGIISIFLSIIFVILVFWLILYSNILANFIPIIHIRNFYNNKVATIIITNSYIQKTGRVNQNLRVYKKTDNMYSYLFIGKFSRIDLEKGLLYLKNNWGKEYAFKLSFVKPVENPDLGKVFYREAQDIGASKVEDTYFMVNLINNENTVIPFTTDDLVRVFWTDPLTLTEIINSVKQGNQESLNVYGTDISTILRIKLK